MTKSYTAAILVIGNEILSGSTQDANIAFIGKGLSEKGIILSEVRIVGDAEAHIISSLNALRQAYDYVFTTGGIGPTHDDITAESISKAFGVPTIIHPEAREIMTAGYKLRNIEMNEGRLRMARTPEHATLIHCEATIAPGFKTENVYTMAGVPKIMQSQFGVILETLEGGKPVLSRKVQCNLKEGDIAIELEDIQKAHPNVDIGSYPHMGQTPSLSLIARGTDEQSLESVHQALSDMVKKYGEEPVY